MLRYQILAKYFHKNMALYTGLFRDTRTPRKAKILLGLALLYLLSPIDVIPDFIPILGKVDDLVVIAVLIFLAMKVIPPQLMQKHRKLCEESDPGNKTPPSKKISRKKTMRKRTSTGKKMPASNSNLPVVVV